ncbi:indolepyruvate ferredoxin oxidoreductase subunit alpha [Desulforamulus ruminis]|uniref:Indolepyruvate oxidoreductase subunit IorA n=1 Tax=Desulforamulus ruminis (strain ATCC 23193 / DSM 2154 / NCIMB 8452 / DL) TaxID=696281 RepID=F6DP97_DESRL|nr:indolepyruvate ferredoxin oxidoreductase subunit alpha [Desulforamulus ruminis]AEG61926.1 indolepyruvate ferredoxin oxidoreductase, alpha subunit [Desulforamulus ruminis DSM 2154]
MKELLSGNAAIARGAYEAGVTVAAGYPGTPSTEILENFARYPGIYAQWSPNEKVALEVGAGASIAGARVLVTMKHVGVNVAADPLFTLAYTGVNGGLLLVSADDPGMHSSQNEQDNRYFAFMNKIPCLEPADSQEAKDMVALGLEISEKFDTPVMLRVTTRVSHSQSFVEQNQPQPANLRPYVKDPQKYVMVPAHGRTRRVFLEERTARLKEYSESCPYNSIEWADRSVGVITSGISYQYAKEILPQASILKLGLTNPMPQKLIKEFAAGVERLLIIEELEPFLESQIRALGLEVTGKDLLPSYGEFNPLLLAGILAQAGFPVAPAYLPRNVAEKEIAADEIPLPGRPPVMCAGCPHRSVFYVLKKQKLIVTGDIGCYTLGSLSPLGAMDTCICMGASIGTALGMEKANPELSGRTVAVIGDSTFLHSGITGLLDVVYNGGNTTVLILDNRTTAMTGHQHNPATGSTLAGQPAPEVDLEALARAVGVKRVRTVNPMDLSALHKVVKEEVAAPEPSVIVVRRPCALLKTALPAEPVEVDTENCINCGICLNLGCPAISRKEEKAFVTAIQCNGCGLCVQVCNKGALQKRGEKNA